MNDPPPQSSKDRPTSEIVRPATALFLALCLYAFPLAFDLPLIDPDEGLHAAIAREMVDRGDFIVPRFLGTPFLDKPIVFFLAQAISIRHFGATELAVRLPGQLFGFLGALTTGAVGAAVAGRQAGLAAACIYATLVFPLVLNQAAVHDVALVPWVNLALLCYIKALQRRNRMGAVFAWCLFAGIWLALAMLTKGLAGIALVGLPVAVLSLMERRLSAAVVAGGIASVVLAAALAMPWYLAVERAAPGYLRYFFTERHLLGFTTTTQMHGYRPWWYYLPIICAGALPWIVTSLAAWRSANDSRDAMTALRRLGTVWLLIDLVFLSAAGSKLATYVLPLFPAIALIATVAWLGRPASRAVPTIHAGDSAAAPVHRDHAVPSIRFMRLVTAQSTISALLLPAACLWALVLLDVRLRVADWIGSAIAAGVWLTIAVVARRCSVRWSFAATLFAVVVTLVTAYLTVFPAVARQRSARDLAAYVNRQGVLPPRLWIVDERVGSLVFYLDDSLRRQVSSDLLDGVALGHALLQGTSVPGTLIAIPDSSAARLEARVDLRDVPFDQAGRYRVYDAKLLKAAPPQDALTSFSSSGSPLAQ